MTRCDQGFIQWLRISGDEDDTALCLKGYLFHLAMVNGSMLKDLVSFDLRRETLASTKLPVEDGGDVDPHLRRSPCLTMADEGCSLAVVMCLKGSGSVWVIEGLEEADDIKCWTWSKRYTLSSMISDSLATCGNFFYLLENGELLLRWNSMITSYNLKTNKEKVVVRKKFRTKAFPYQESLIVIP